MLFDGIGLFLLLAAYFNIRYILIKSIKD